jgi:hypothetical protein
MDKLSSSADARTGHDAEIGKNYQGEPVRFGRDYFDYFKGAIYHEFFHVAGMMHEHQRADAGEHIHLDLDRLLGNQTDRETFRKNEKNQMGLDMGTVLSHSSHLG